MGKILNDEEMAWADAFIKMMKKKGFVYAASILDDKGKCETLILSRKEIKHPTRLK